MSDELNAFREEARQWISDNFPESLRGRGLGMEEEERVELGPDMEVWRERLASRGWGAPTWPREYGGADLSHPEVKAWLRRWMPWRVQSHSHHCRYGVTMVGPTVLEYGTEDQKQRHLPGIASGEIRWCLGLSEPNAGSDLASLSTRAEDNGDSFLLNGQKIWTSGADISSGAARWCAPTRAPSATVSASSCCPWISRVETRPIKLIAGASPFCETFFNDARGREARSARRAERRLERGQALLQHERQSQTGRAWCGGVPQSRSACRTWRNAYVGSNDDGTLADADLRVRARQPPHGCPGPRTDHRPHPAEARGQRGSQRRRIDSEELGHQGGADQGGADRRA